jgi:hypothetical protein
MNSFGVVENEILGKLFVKELFVRKRAPMIVNELLLDGSVVPFDIGIDLWAPGIGEGVEDTFISMSVCYKSSREVDSGNWCDATRVRIIIYSTRSVFSMNVP